MSSGQATVADLDREIQRLEGERKRIQDLLQDPVQRTEREKLRERLVGVHMMELIRQGDSKANTWLPSVIVSASAQAWVFDTEVMQADGYQSAPAESGSGVVWSRSSQSRRHSPSDGAGP